MRIGFDAKRIYHNSTGLGNYGRDLIRILSNYHPNNKYFLYNPKPKRIDRLIPKENVIEKTPRTKFWKCFSSIWRQGPIIQQLKKDEIDIFHGLTGELPKNIEKKAIRTVVTIHDLIFVRYPKLYSVFDRKIHFKKVKNAVGIADKIIAISEQTKNDIVQFLKVEATKIDVIYQGCHQAFKETASKEFKQEVIHKYGLPSEFILNVGTINERKNLLSLVMAIKNLDISLVVVGSKTDYYEQVETYIAKHSLEDRIFIIQGVAIQELAAIYQQAKVFVYPSIFEGFGIPIIEALYSKTPVITSTGSCFPEAGGPNSIYVKWNNVAGLEEQIKNVLKSQILRNQMVGRGFEFVQKFNDDVIAGQYDAIYKGLS